MKINIGCSRDYRQGWLNTDISNATKADVYFDIRKDTIIKGATVGADKIRTIPVLDNEANEIYISGVLEQIGENEHLIHALNECWRVLIPGGKLVIVVPNAKYAIAHRDPMDIRKFTPDTFRYFLEDTQEYRDYGSVYGFKPWRNLDIQENQRHILTVTMIK